MGAAARSDLQISLATASLCLARDSQTFGGSLSQVFTPHAGLMMVEVGNLQERTFKLQMTLHDDHFDELG